jgi:hypothetical protein
MKGITAHFDFSGAFWVVVAIALLAICFHKEIAVLFQVSQGASSTPKK